MSPFNLAKLAEYYGLSLDYLMGLTENKNHSNTSLHELHLNDSTVVLLKSGTLNNRLICEMICQVENRVYQCFAAGIWTAF